MKTIHEILILMYQEYINDVDPDNSKETLNHSGLCNVLWVLRKSGKITKKECNIATRYLYKNQPKKLYNDAYFWTLWVRRYRLLWMEKHMKLTK